MPSDYDDSRQDDDYVRCVLNAQPRGYWRMNETGGDFGDSAGAGRTALVLDANGLTYADERLVPSYGDAGVRVTHAATVVDIGPPGPPSGPFAYVGTRPQITVPDDPEIRGDGTFSLECWFYVTDTDFLSSDPAERALLLHKVLVTGPPDATQRHTGYSLYFLGPNLVFALTGDSSSGGSLTFDYPPFRANHLVVRVRPDGWLDGMLNGVEIVPSAITGPNEGVLTATAGPNDGAPLLIASDASDFVPEGQDPSAYTITFTTRAPHAVVGHVAYYDYYLKDGVCAQHYAVGVAGGVRNVGTVYTEPRRGQKVWTMGGAPYGDEPDGWTDRTFDDSGWGDAVVMTRDNSFSSFNVLVKPDGPRQLRPPMFQAYTAGGGTLWGQAETFAPAFWMCDDNLPFRGATDRFLLRLPVRIGPTRPSAASATFFADDQMIDVYLNGTLLFSDDGITGAFPYAITTAQCNLFVLNATNVFAIRVTNGTYNAGIGSDGAYDGALGVAFAFEQLTAGHLLTEAPRIWYALL